MVDCDLTTTLQTQIAQAITDRTPLQIVGGNSKTFYGGISTATHLLELKNHRGIIAYEPSELVITVRAGTPLHTIETILSEHQQMLAFEPPYFSPTATIGGTLACGFSGPRRPFAGSARDFVLGCRLINGHAEVLHFGGQVIKNVAGFDVSRLMVGAMGQLGVLLDISIRVLPKPEDEITRVYPIANAQTALEWMQHKQNQPWPLSALCYTEGNLYYRLSGATAAIQAAAQKLGGDEVADGSAFWYSLREQQSAFFQQAGDLWRLSLPPASPALDVPGHWLLDWGGAQRWLKTTETSDRIHTLAHRHNGHAVCIRSSHKTDWFRLEPGLLSLQQKIRHAFDPYRLFNPHRFLPDL